VLQQVMGRLFESQTERDGAT